jgi:hypothetical protein
MMVFSKKEDMMDLEKKMIIIVMIIILDFLVMINIMEKVLYIKMEKKV